MHSAEDLEPWWYMQPVIEYKQEEQQNIERKCGIKNYIFPTLHALNKF
jgi:hypothetical protein